MKIISAGVQRPAVIIFAFTSFLLLNVFPAFAQDNSRAPVQKANSVQKADTDQKANDCTFSHDLNAETITFEAVNPKTQVAGLMTVTISGAVRGNRLWDGESAVGSHLQSQLHSVFSFVPYDPYSPSYSGAVTRLELSGDTKDDSILFDFGLKATGSDGSVQWFMLRQVVTATEAGAQIAFTQVATPDELIRQPEIPCGSVVDEKGALVKRDTRTSARP